MRKRSFFAVLLPLFAFLLLFSGCQQDTPENPAATAATTEAPSENAQPKPEKLPALTANSVILLPEGAIWGLFWETDGSNLIDLLNIFSNADVYAAEEAPGPWTRVLFFQNDEKKAAYAVSPGNVIRAETDGGYAYYRLAEEKPLLETLTAFYEKHLSPDNVRLPALEAIQRAKAQEFLADGNTEVRLLSFTETYSLPVSSRYTYAIYEGTYCALPAGQQEKPWKEYTHVFPVLLDHAAGTAVELEQTYLPAQNWPGRRDYEAAFLSALENDPAYSPVLGEAGPFIWLRRIQLREGSLRLLAGNGEASGRPAVSFRDINDWFLDLTDCVEWAECEAPPLEGSLGVEAQSEDGLSAAFYEGDVACIKTPDRERWLQGTWTSPPDTSSFLHSMGYNSVYDAARMLYSYWEHVPDGLVLKTDTSDPAAVAVQLMNLWGKKLQRLSHDNPYAVKSFAASEADTSKVEGYSDDPNVYAYMVGYSLVPASSEGYNLRYDENIDENGTVHYGGLAVFQKLDNGTWVFLRFHYGAQF